MEFNCKYTAISILLTLTVSAELVGCDHASISGNLPLATSSRLSQNLQSNGGATIYLQQSSAQSNPARIVLRNSSPPNIIVEYVTSRGGGELTNEIQTEYGPGTTIIIIQGGSTGTSSNGPQAQSEDARTRIVYQTKTVYHHQPQIAQGLQPSMGRNYGVAQPTATHVSYVPQQVLGGPSVNYGHQPVNPHTHVSQFPPPQVNQVQPPPHVIPNTMNHGVVHGPSYQVPYNQGPPLPVHGGIESPRINMGTIPQPINQPPIGPVSSPTHGEQPSRTYGHNEQRHPPVMHQTTAMPQIPPSQVPIVLPSIEPTYPTITTPDPINNEPVVPQRKPVNRDVVTGTSKPKTTTRPTNRPSTTKTPRRTHHSRPEDRNHEREVEDSVPLPGRRVPWAEERSVSERVRHDHKPKDTNQGLTYLPKENSTTDQDSNDKEVQGLLGTLFTSSDDALLKRNSRSWRRRDIDFEMIYKATPEELKKQYQDYVILTKLFGGARETNLNGNQPSPAVIEKVEKLALPRILVYGKVPA